MLGVAGIFYKKFDNTTNTSKPRRDAMASFPRVDIKLCLCRQRDSSAPGVSQWPENGEKIHGLSPSPYSRIVSHRLCINVGTSRVLSRED